jgi:hypothetical protein
VFAYCTNASAGVPSCAVKRLHRDDLYGWSRFDEARNIDFNSLLWVRDEGNVIIDPLPLSDHDRAHLDELGGAAIIVITNSDHVRDAVAVQAHTGAVICGPADERERFPIECDRWIEDGDEIVPRLVALALQGSKTPGELALVLDEHTLITGDLVRASHGGALCLLPDRKLGDREQALLSLKRLAMLPGVTSVLPGDGWPIFRHGGEALTALHTSLAADKALGLDV